jgi:RNA polymerase sigma-70 factor (ECF subfamily)
MKNHDMRQQLVQLGNGAHALALQMLGNSDDATDAVHDAFVKVLKKPGSYDAGSGPLTPWFLRVVRNQCIDLIRRRRPAHSNVEELIDPRPGPEDVTQAAQRDRELQHALSRLSDGQRQIIVLRDYLELSYAEIAHVLEIAMGTVMSQQPRARRGLSAVLGHF